MNKNTIIGIVVVVIAVLGIGGYFLLNNKDKTNETEKTPTNNPTINENKDNKTPSSNGKTLVVYYSATGSTKKVAEEIANNLNADIFIIESVDAYTSEDLDYTNDNSRVSKEHNDEQLRDVKLKNTKVSNWESYDTVLIGFPIWWGAPAWTVDSFVKNNNFNGKTVIPFCTSASSDLGQSKELLESKANSGNWIEGKRFSSSASSSDIKAWTDSLSKSSK